MQANGAAQAVLFSCLLMAASVWDIRKRTIPDTLCAAVFLIGLLTFAPEKPPGILLGLPLLIGAMIAGSCKAGGIGGGDIKLTAACCFVLGIPAGTEGLLLGLAAFGCGYLALKAFRKIKHQSQPSARRTALPMVPFLSAGFISAYFVNFGGAIL